MFYKHMSSLSIPMVQLQGSSWLGNKWQLVVIKPGFNQSVQSSQDNVNN